jgi:cytochrome c-type biogenesis protein CcmH
MSLLRALTVLLALLGSANEPRAASPTDIEDQTRALAAELRCVVCQNLSVADSPSEMAQQMRAVVREQLEAGKTPEEVKEFFVSKYGEWVLLKPKTTGVSAVLWILPYAVLLAGIAAALRLIRRWAAVKRPVAPLSSGAAAELAGESLAGAEPPHPEDPSARAALLRERTKLREELSELDFDFESGKLSASDHAALNQELEKKLAAVLQQLRALPAEPVHDQAPREKVDRRDRARAAAGPGPRRWQLVTGAVFLVVLGLTLGVMLTQSLRPRLSESDTLTGDFLTGTSSSSIAVARALAEAKTAFGQGELPKAIEAFKKVLAAEPDHPEAHTYMGYILLQAGHGDGALMAFDKALTRAPDLPMALWGKGMVLYREKQDVAGARAIFEKLLTLVPPGEERNQVAKVLAELPPPGGETRNRPAQARDAKATSSAGQISGKITLAAGLESQANPGAALFIIARSSAAAAGPPLAVKKIERPKFPLDYSLNQDNLMIQGTPFTGKITVSVRLDKDGNPSTRGPGDMSGEYRKNPVEIGSTSVDIVIDQVAK